MSIKPKLIRITTAPASMNIILRGQLKFMSDYFEVVGITKADDKHFEMILDREGIRMIPLNFERTIKPLKDLIVLIQLIGVFIREKPDIVHTHTPKAGLLGMLAGRITRVPIRIHTVGGMPLMGLNGIKQKIVRATEKLTYHCAHQVWPNSIGLKDWIIQHRLCRTDKMEVIGHGASNGVNTLLFDPENREIQREAKALRDEMNIGERDLVFVYIGRIAKEKGMNELSQAFDDLSEQFTNIHLLLIGLFEEEHGGMDQADRERLLKTKNVHWPGRADDVRKYLAMSDVFVLPSYREGFPNALMEAGAMGLPAIATDINGCNEIIRHQENGLLVPIKEAEPLKEAMVQMMRDESVRKKMGQKGREAIVKYFDNSIIWKSMLSAYQSALNVSTEA